VIVYLVTGPAGKQYVGQTIRTFKNRKLQHLSDSRNGRRSYVHNAFRKHGTENFTWKILDYCQSLDELNERESFWILRLNTLSPSGYNLMTGGRNSRHSIETKKKISEIMKSRSPEIQRKISEAHKGKTLSPEHRRKISEANRGRGVGPENPMYGKTHTLETRRKLSEAARNPSPETRRKMREVRKRRDNSMYGKTYIVTLETRRKMSEAHKGVALSPEQRKKMSEAQKGRIHSPETRRKIGAANRNPSGETRKKMSASQKKRFQDTKREEVISVGL